MAKTKKLFEKLSAYLKASQMSLTVSERIYLMIGLLVTIPEIIFNISETYGLGSIWGFSGSTLLRLTPLYIYVFVLVACLCFPHGKLNTWLKHTARALLKAVSRLGWINWLFFLLLIGLYGFNLLSGIDLPLIGSHLRIFLVGHLGLLGALLLAGTKRLKPISGLVVSFSVIGLILFVISWIPDIHPYPLSLGWSETSRYYYASLFFSQRLYGLRAPLSSLHPSRYLMQSLPFLISGLPLWAHRLWQVLLWIGLSLAGGFALSRRIKPDHPWLTLGITVWFTLFVFQGPVYYHLMVVILIVLLGFNYNKLGQSLVFVVLASLWAGISRVNWFPVAGMLAVTLYVLEVPQGDESFWRYWRWPVIAVLAGFLMAFASQAAYVAISGNPPDVFASSFSSPLLSYRLFPNDAFGPGILLMLVYASLPTLLVIFWKLLPRLRSWQPLRLLALLSILVALLVVGLIVSMKIGGGNNLHNLDAFLVFLAIVAMYVLCGRFLPYRKEKFTRIQPPVVFILLMALIPMFNLLNHMQPYPHLDDDRTWDVIQ
jgi:hypothetical protein